MPVPVDDLTIENNELLFHRIRQADIVEDSETGQLRPASTTFRSKANTVSVSRASLTTAAKVLADYPGYELVEIQAGVVRSFGCIVVADNLPEDPSHALIYGSGPGGCLTKHQAKSVVKACDWVTNPRRKS